jgi:hypothetical protein
MPSHVIATLDGSTNAEAILPHALFFARETQSVLTLLRVIMPPGEPAYGVPYILDDCTREKSCGRGTTWAAWPPVSSRRASVCKRITLRACCMRPCSVKQCEVM